MSLTNLLLLKKQYFRLYITLEVENKQWMNGWKDLAGS